ncbi:ABC transporter permease [Ottowia thiooxydans]|uniref:ABC transporter permease n=1 Tax=Ottowia thiooxydans TaxID=219182 RepID=UPI0004059645|nr:ABC transporter permease subunit [Ottowia thiooxydans]
MLSPNAASDVTTAPRSGWLARIGRYLWGGWTGAASVLLFVAAWDALARQVGPLVLPTPQETMASLGQIAQSAEAWRDLGATARRALAGYGLSVLAGSVLGMAAGASMTATMMARPLITLLIGMPPIAWLVLALLWFGSGDATPVFTVFVACFPIVFVGALQGTRALDGRLQELARAYRLPLLQRLTDVYLPHIASYLFAACITALGVSWKVVLMAELLATTDGAGAQLAVTRSHLDMSGTLAWVSAVVGLLLLAEYLLLEPIRREMERWRMG